MLKKFIIILTLIIILTGCNKKEIQNTIKFTQKLNEKIEKISEEITNQKPFEQYPTRPKLSTEDCLQSFLGAHIASLETNFIDKNLNEIIDIDMKKIEYSKVTINLLNSKNNGMYVILKTKDEEIKEKLQKYFTKNYTNYHHMIVQDYIIYLWNRQSDFNLYDNYMFYEGTC